MTTSYPDRKQLRLRNFDYSSAGAYFVTICTQARKCLFGRIDEGLMELSPAGEMVSTLWQEIPERHTGIEIDEYIVMPNHFHGIIWLTADGQGTGDGSRLALPDLMREFKSETTTRYCRGVKEADWARFERQLWQRSYYDRVLRDERKLSGARQYTVGNPGTWEKDTLHPDNRP